jgi:predicted RNA methylase
MPIRRPNNAGAKPNRKLVLTTQPGWAFATLAELRSLGVTEQVEFHHRDSTLVVSDRPDLRSGMTTVADVFGAIAASEGSTGVDATESLRNGLRAAAIKRQVLGWLPSTPGKGLRRFAVTTEVYGRTRLQRRQLSDAVVDVVQQALPRWRRTRAEGLRIACKADTRAAVLGVQLYSNLAPAEAYEQDGPPDDSLPGALREHLASGLLALAAAGPGTIVFDPFLGTGTILDAAQRHFGVSSGTGLDISPQAFRLASQKLDVDRFALANSSFEDFDTSSVSADTALVSNVPFGVRFEQPPTDRLGQFLDACVRRGASLTLLLARDQADAVGPALGLRVKNVLVLGQPASIIYRPLPR